MIYNLKSINFLKKNFCYFFKVLLKYFHSTARAYYNVLCSYIVGGCMETSKKNVLSFLEDKTNRYSERTALGIKTQTGWNEYSYRGIGLMSRKLASYLINDLQVKKGEKCAILSESKPEFGACVFASIIAGMTTVPLDIKLTKYELHSILCDSEPVVLLVSNSFINIALELKNEIESLKTIIVMDNQGENANLPNIYSIPNNYDCKWRHRARKSTALIIYTSGTTGAPKGVEITFENMFAQLDALQAPIANILPMNHVNILSILPMNHLFELTVGFATFLNSGFSVYYSQSLKPKDIMSTMTEKQIQFMIVVPAFLKLLKTGIEAEIKNYSKPAQAAFKIMFNLAKFIPFVSVKRLMFKKIHDKFGGKFVGCISGGAPLDTAVGKFFETIGIRVYQGYGLSETSPVVAVNTNHNRSLESVGEPLSGFECKIDPQTGELLLKGPSVMKGYHNQPEITAEVLEPDGWLHTGDIANIGKNGHLYITGRIKNMIVLSGGKKVFPEEVESVLEKSPLLAEVCVFGHSRTFGSKDGSEEIIAAVVPTEEVINQYDEKELDKIIKAEVKHLSLHLTQYKRPNTVIVSRLPFPRTTTRKIKRKEVKELVSA